MDSLNEKEGMYTYQDYVPTLHVCECVRVQCLQPDLVFLLTEHITIDYWLHWLPKLFPFIKNSEWSVEVYPSV